MSFIAFVLALTGTVDAAIESHTHLQAKTLLQAAEAYTVHPANKSSQYPGTIADLVKPPFAKISFLKDNEKDLMDPWGGIFRCRTDVDDRGNVRFHVWTERVLAGEVRRIGYPPPEKK